LMVSIVSALRGAADMMGRVRGGEAGYGGAKGNGLGETKSHRVGVSR